METFILKIYRGGKGANKLVGTLQNINSNQHFSFTTQKEIYSLLTSLINEEEEPADSDDPESDTQQQSA